MQFSDLRRVVTNRLDSRGKNGEETKIESSDVVHSKAARLYTNKMQQQRNC